MSINYYESIDPLETKNLKFEDIEVIQISKKEKFPGVFIRKLQIKHNGEKRIVEHLQDINWIDNTRPDDGESQDSYIRMSYLLSKVKKHRTNQHKSKVLVHCRYL